jgi:metallophosphoesterase (TIGR03768 family)
MKTIKNYSFFCIFLLLFSSLLFSENNRNQGNKNIISSYPIETTVWTTAEKMIIPSKKPSQKITLKDVSKYKKYGYGKWTMGDGLETVVRKDLIPANYRSYNITNIQISTDTNLSISKDLNISQVENSTDNINSVQVSSDTNLNIEENKDITENKSNVIDIETIASTKKTKLLNFFTISDIHITDKESPAQLIYIQQLNENLGIVTSLYSPVMLYTTHVLDATIQTINALHKKDPFDVGISLGDVCNSAQYNELRWYIDVIDGKTIYPSSGKNKGAKKIDYQKPYQAVGLDKTIPWYQVFGNHDQFFMGSFPVNNFLKEMYIGNKVLATADILKHPFNATDFLTDPENNKTKNPFYYMGVIDGTTPYGDIKYAGNIKDFRKTPRIIPDPNRRALNKNEWIKEFFNTTSNPVGHGFKMSNIEENFACYSFIPKSNLPIKFIVLDNTQLSNDGSKDIHGHGFLDQKRWDWLKKELADGDAKNQLMIICSHIPIDVEKSDVKSEMGWWQDPKNAVSLENLKVELFKHPNLLMWLSGHRHLNTVKAFISPDENAPEKGFWQVETSSLRDFPQQFRKFQIYLNTDYTISIQTINVDPAVKEGTPAAKSREYAIAAKQIMNEDRDLYNPTNDPTIFPTTLESYNAELVKILSPEMKQALKDMGL